MWYMYVLDITFLAVNLFYFDLTMDSVGLIDSICRVRTQKVEPVSKHGKSGPMMAQNSKLLNSWKKMLEQLCNFFSPRPFALCLCH